MEANYHYARASNYPNARISWNPNARAIRPQLTSLYSPHDGSFSNVFATARVLLNATSSATRTWTRDGSGTG